MKTAEAHRWPWLQLCWRPACWSSFLKVNLCGRCRPSPKSAPNLSTTAPPVCRLTGKGGVPRPCNPSIIVEKDRTRKGRGPICFCSDLTPTLFDKAVVIDAADFGSFLHIPTAPCFSEAPPSTPPPLAGSRSLRIVVGHAKTMLFQQQTKCPLFPGVTNIVRNDVAK